MTNFKRRAFIKNTLLTGVSPWLLPAETGNLSGDPMAIEVLPGVISTGKKVIVAGAGLAGLCCAYELMKNGHEVIVLEASPRHGGHVFTLRDGLSDGLYADGGAEQIIKPGYERYWEYTKEFHLEVLPYPRRKDMLRRKGGKFYSDKMLADPKVIAEFGFNEQEINYLTKHPWGELKTLYLKPYLDKFTDEYQPYGVGYDHLEHTPISDIYKKEGASPAAQKMLGGNNTSALFALWRSAILNIRGVPAYPKDIYRLKGGNQSLPDAFAKRLGRRVLLNCPIIAINNGENEVTVTYNEFGLEKQVKADYLANCIPLPAFRKIPVTPALSPEKQYVVDNVNYGIYCHFVFQASSRFWIDDGLESINLELNHPDIFNIWQVADEVDTHRVVLLADGPAGISAQRALAAFREVYPGKKDTIEQALVKDWSKEQFANTCERIDFPMGELRKFWPEIMRAERRIHFAGAYADNLNWGQEAATRSANRVALEIINA